MSVRRATLLGNVLAVAVVVAGALGGTPSLRAAQGGSWVVEAPELVVEGEEFEVYVSFGGPPGGLPSLSLYIQDGSEPLVQLKSEETVYNPSSGTGISNTWTLTALQDGAAELRAYVYYEKFFPCEEPCGPPVMSFVGESYEFSVEIAPQEEPPALLGDVNADGAVDSRDALLILQYGAALIGVGPAPEVADLNDDGLVDSRDATLILQYDAGMIESLG